MAEAKPAKQAEGATSQGEGFASYPGATGSPCRALSPGARGPALPFLCGDHPLPAVWTPGRGPREEGMGSVGREASPAPTGSRAARGRFQGSQIAAAQATGPAHGHTLTFMWVEFWPVGPGAGWGRPRERAGARTPMETSSARRPPGQACTGLDDSQFQKLHCVFPRDGRLALAAGHGSGAPGLDNETSKLLTFLQT